MTEWDNIKVRDLQRFTAVVEAGSFTSAAAGMDETPKQLSRRVALLEEQLGTRLFHRTTRSVRPTTEGTIWYADVRAILDRLQEATEAVRPSESLRGLVRIQVPTLFVDDLQDWVGEQLERHPELAIDLLVGDRSDDLLARGIDICLSGVPPTGATLLVRSVGTVAPTLAAHRSYLERHGVPTEPEDLEHHACLRFVGPTPQREWTLENAAGERRTVRVGGRLACNDSRSLLRALVRGHGIGPFNETMRRQAEPGEVVPVLPGWRFEKLTMFLALAPGRRRLPAVRYVADAIIALTGQSLTDEP